MPGQGRRAEGVGGEATVTSEAVVAMLKAAIHRLRRRRARGGAARITQRYRGRLDGDLNNDGRPDRRKGPSVSTLAGRAVLEAGRRTGNEFITVANRRRGTILPIETSGANDAVALTPQMRAFLTDRGGEVHHNHPRSSSLSGQDLVQSARFGAKVVAYGHDGSVYAAKARTNTRRDAVRSRIMMRAWEAAMIAVSREAVALRRARWTDRSYREIAEDDLHHVANLALAKAKLISYRFRLSATAERRLRPHQGDIQRIAHDVSRRLRRLTFT